MALSAISSSANGQLISGSLETALRRRPGRDEAEKSRPQAAPAAGGVTAVKQPHLLARRVLYTPALTASRRNPVVQAFYERLIAAGKLLTHADFLGSPRKRMAGHMGRAEPSSRDPNAQPREGLGALFCAVRRLRQ
jgi:hypothetical protein